MECLSLDTSHESLPTQSEHPTAGNDTATSITKESEFCLRSEQVIK